MMPNRSAANAAPPNHAGFRRRTLPSASHALTLAQVIDRLAQHEVVEGLMTIGSTATPDLDRTSDYDLVVVLASRPVPLHVGLTTIDGRLTDLLFVDRAALDRILADEHHPASPSSWDGRTIRWLRTGTIAFDRTGRLAATQAKARTEPLLAPISADELDAEWFAASYNLLHNQRLLSSSDPVALLALDIRLLYSLFQVFAAYFQARGLLWEGEKAAVRHLQAHDPDYLALFTRCLSETDRIRKFRHYERLVDLALVPIGDPWRSGETGLQTAATSDRQSDANEIALTFWNDLMSEESEANRKIDTTKHS